MGGFVEKIDWYGSDESGLSGKLGKSENLPAIRTDSVLYFFSPVTILSLSLKNTHIYTEYWLTYTTIHLPPPTVLPQYSLQIWKKTAKTQN